MARLHRVRVQLFTAGLLLSAITNSLFVIVLAIVTICFVARDTNYNVVKTVNINGYNVAVVIPTQEEERALEARNFEETKDLKRLYNSLGINGKKNVVVISVGSTYSHVLYGSEHMTKTEFDMGVDNHNNLTDVLDSVKYGCDYVCFTIATGYGIKVDAGAVVSDNVSAEYNVAENIIDGTGNNRNAMSLVEKLLELHKRIGHQFIMAFVPRGEPQGGSHSKQRIVDAIRSSNGLPVTVIEISGKQTTKFYIADKDNDWELDRNSTEELCNMIKEIKIVDENGKTYGSKDIFQ